MRFFLLCLVTGLFATSVLAQQTVNNPPAPVPAATPAAALPPNAQMVPTPTVVAPVATTPATAPTQKLDLSAQLQKVMASKQGQQNLGPMLAVGTLLSCTQKQVGKPAAQTFYGNVQTISKAVHEDCKQGNVAGAKQLALAGIDANAKDPVSVAALNCYDTQHSALEGFAGADWSARAARYVGWVRNPALAHQQITDADVCPPSKTQ